MATTRRSVSVVWELSGEGTVVVDVDAPVRPFGEVPTPPKGTLVPTPAPAPHDEAAPREGRRRTLPRVNAPR